MIKTARSRLSVVYFCSLHRDFSSFIFFFDATTLVYRLSRLYIRRMECSNILTSNFNNALKARKRERERETKKARENALERLDKVKTADVRPPRGNVSETITARRLKWSSAKRDRAVKRPTFGREREKLKNFLN